MDKELFQGASMYLIGRSHIRRLSDRSEFKPLPPCRFTAFAAFLLALSGYPQTPQVANACIHSFGTPPSKNLPSRRDLRRNSVLMQLDNTGEAGHNNSGNGRDDVDNKIGEGNGSGGGGGSNGAGGGGNGDDNEQEDENPLRDVFFGMCLVYGVRHFLIEPRHIPSESMEPTFQIGDHLVVDKISSKWRDYARNDVVIFRPPSSFLSAIPSGMISKDSRVIKRIVALSGDTVQVKHGRLFVNGERQDETFIRELARYKYGPITVPEGHVFVLGDNRNNSFDGHVWGVLPKADIIGRATLKYWPPRKVGRIYGAPA